MAYVERDYNWEVAGTEARDVWIKANGYGFVSVACVSGGWHKTTESC